MKTNNNKTLINKNNAGKLLGAAGLSALAAPAINAAVVRSATIPTDGLRPPSSAGNTNWDVDGDGTTDFLLGYSVRYHDIDDAGGGRLVVTAGLASDGIALLNAGETVGAILAPGRMFHANAQSYNTILFNGAIDVDVTGWQAGVPGFFGFRFTSGGDTHYGWGEMLIAADSSTFTVTRAWYEDVAGASIQVGAIPEPAELGLGLGVLALGAAGLRRTRQAKARLPQGKEGS